MTAPVLTGPACRQCRKSEARCAYDQGCCHACTHTFDGTTADQRTCRDCHEPFTIPGLGRPPTRCPTCR